MPSFSYSDAGLLAVVRSMSALSPIRLAVPGHVASSGLALRVLRGQIIYAAYHLFMNLAGGGSVTPAG